jgi:CHASE3 domain sensor protein
MERRRSVSRASRRNTRMPGIASGVLMVIVGLSYSEWWQYRRANGDPAQLRQIVDSVDQVLSCLLDAENGQRGFLLTGENRHLQPYDQAVERIPNESHRGRIWAELNNGPGVTVPFSLPAEGGGEQSPAVSRSL